MNREPCLPTTAPTYGPALTRDTYATTGELLDKRVRFESLLARLSATFIHLPADQVDGQINDALRQIVTFLGLERASLAQFSADGRELWATHSYAAAGAPPFPNINLAAIWPWYTAQVRTGTTLRYTDLPDELPPEAVAEREAYRRGPLPRSHLAITFRVGGEVIGGIGFGSFSRRYDWSDELVQSLQLVGEVFANALARRRAEEQAGRLRDQLALTARVTLLGELAASIAHEVNQPLCAIIANAEAADQLLALGDLLETSAALKDIVRDGHRAGSVLERIRGLLRQAPAERVRLDMNSLIEEVAALVRADLKRRRVGVALDLADGLPPVRGDRVQVQQVLLNLLVNGADALDAAGADERTLRIESRPEAGAVRVAVRDRGIGLGAAGAARLFDAFYTTKPGGMGMGLAICRSIVEAHGGKIWAEPNHDRGTVFQFTLPQIAENRS